VVPSLGQAVPVSLPVSVPVLVPVLITVLLGVAVPVLVPVFVAEGVDFRLPPHAAKMRIGMEESRTSNGFMANSSQLSSLARCRRRRLRNLLRRRWVISVKQTKIPVRLIEVRSVSAVWKRYWQTPATQVWPVTHLLPQAPQFDALVLVFTQVSPQRFWPVGQPAEQRPASHIWPGGQTVSQSPQ
jgi:hypothetical protein